MTYPRWSISFSIYLGSSEGISKSRTIRTSSWANLALSVWINPKTLFWKHRYMNNLTNFSTRFRKRKLCKLPCGIWFHVKIGSWSFITMGFSPIVPLRSNCCGMSSLPTAFLRPWSSIWGIFYFISNKIKKLLKKYFWKCIKTDLLTYLWHIHNQLSCTIFAIQHFGK